MLTIVCSGHNARAINTGFTLFTGEVGVTARAASVVSAEKVAPTVGVESAGVFIELAGHKQRSA
jgi:hypothetical protein